VFAARWHHAWLLDNGVSVAAMEEDSICVESKVDNVRQQIKTAAEKSPEPKFN